MMVHLDEAIDAVRDAQSALVPTNKIKTSEAYILGSMKAALATLATCKDIVKSAIDSQAKSKVEAKPDVPQLHD